MSRHGIRTAASGFAFAVTFVLSGCGGAGTDPIDGVSSGVVPIKIYQQSHPARGYVDANGNLYTHINPGQHEAYGGAPQSGYTWSVTSGTSMPFPGMIISPLTGLVSGSIPNGTAAGQYTYSVTVTDGTSSYTSTSAYIQVQACNSGPASNPVPGNCNVPPVLSCGSGTLSDINLGGLSAYKAGQPVGFSLFVNGGTPPYKSWALVSGTLPPGTSIDASRGVLTGTPLSSAAGTTYNFSVKVSDATNATCPAAGASAAQYKITLQ